jgi:diguanylate cyclase (GGDEF)-like protein
MNDPKVFSTLRSALAVPLEGSAGVMGVLALYHEGKDAFTKEHLRIVQSITPKLSLSIEEACRERQAADSTVNDGFSVTPSGRRVLETLEAELKRCRRLGISIGVLVCSVDNFEQLTSKHGKLEADKVMRSVVAALRDSCREYDFFARLSGNEFIMVMPGCDSETLRARAARVMHISNVSGREALSVLVGDACSPEDGVDAEELLGVADRRMFAIRRQRRLSVESVQNRTTWLQ